VPSSKTQFNGVGGTPIHLSFIHFGLKASIGRRRAMNIDFAINTDLGGIKIPNSKLAREITELVRDTEPALLFHHSSRVYYWASLAGKRRVLSFDPELLYASAMFHDMGLSHLHSRDERFEVDSANVARDFLRRHGIAQQDIDIVWTAIALHTTPGIPQHMHPVIALVTAGVEMDVLGINYSQYSDGEREAVVHAHPRSAHFKEDIIQAFFDGIKHKPETTFGNVKADVLADKDASFRRGNFCSVIRSCAWPG
jgi:HD superfamily phosphodiesterase